MKVICDLTIPSSVTLYTAADVVQHGFIVQDSITPLNLELCQHYVFCENRMAGDYETFSYSNEIITTEEKCRKILAKGRSLLYTLHLDLPKGRERNLRSNSQHVDLQSSRRRDVAQIKIHEDFYAAIVFSLIPDACKGRSDNFKVLKWIITSDDFDKTVFRNIPLSTTNYFFDCIHSNLDDSEFMIGCLTKLNVYTWLLCNEPSKIRSFESLVKQMNRIEKNGNFSICYDDFVDFCVILPTFKFARDALKLRYAPRFSVDLYFFYLEEIYAARHAFAKDYHKESVTFRRSILLAQMFWVYLKHLRNWPGGAEFLRLIWSSVPDPLLSSYEITKAFEEGFASEEVTGAYNFYSESVQPLHSYVEPRLLKHYCRTSIRRRLTQLGHWLPDGIKELVLPNILQSYLNLE